MSHHGERTAVHRFDGSERTLGNGEQSSCVLKLLLENDFLPLQVIQLERFFLIGGSAGEDSVLSGYFYPFAR